MLTAAGELHDLKLEFEELKSELIAAEEELERRDERDRINEDVTRAADVVLRKQNTLLQHHKRAFDASAATVRTVLRELGKQVVFLSFFAWHRCYVRQIRAMERAKEMQARSEAEVWSEFCFRQADRADKSWWLLFMYHVWAGAGGVAMPLPEKVQAMRAVILFWQYGALGPAASLVWWLEYQIIGRMSSVWWFVCALCRAWIALVEKERLTKKATDKLRRVRAQTDGALAIQSGRWRRDADERVLRAAWFALKQGLLTAALEKMTQRCKQRALQVEHLSIICEQTMKKYNVRVYVRICFLSWSRYLAKRQIATMEDHMKRSIAAMKDKMKTAMAVMDEQMKRVMKFFYMKRLISGFWSGWLRLVRGTIASHFQLCNYFYSRHVFRALAGTCFRGWYLLVIVHEDMRLLSRSHLFVLKRQQGTHNLRLKRCLFSIWECTRELLAVGERAADVEAASAQHRPLQPRHLRECVEALVSIRSRRWRLFVELRSTSEGALLRVGEIREAMLVLIQQGARQAMPPSELVPAEEELLKLEPMADLQRLMSEVRGLESKLSDLSKLRTALGSDLLKATAVAMRILLESRRGGGLDTDVKAAELLGRELGQLAVDEKRLTSASGELVARLEEANSELESVSALRLELDLAVGLESTEVMANDSRAVIKSGAGAQQVLRAAVESVVHLQGDADSLLRYLENSTLLGGLFNDAGPLGGSSAALESEQ